MTVNVQTSNFDLWKMPLILTMFSVIYLLLLYYPTTSSTVAIWNRSDTFAHGYLIFPISIWLIWQRRKEIALLTPQPINWPAAIVALGSLGWLVAFYVDVLVVQQLALVAMIPFVVFALLGWQATKQLSFPLFFLIFAVPMGEGLVPGLIEFTADFTVAMVKLVGIPIYREGNYFELPTGNWSVVEACSGVRYLIASITLGCLYAYLTYQTTWKRIAFIAVSVVVPIIANGLRAFMIVMIGHFSDMQLATGVDHLIYGWLFFGVVVAIMFYVGSFWREDRVDVKPASPSVAGVVQVKSTNGYITFGIVMLAVSVAPIVAYSEAELTRDQLNVSLSVPVSESWKPSQSQLTQWHPLYAGVDADIHQTYQRDNVTASLYVGYYVKQRQGSELITSTNLLVSNDEKSWRSIDQGKLEFSSNGKSASAMKAIVKSASEEYLVAYYYIVDGKITTNQYITKLHEAKARMLGGDKSASIVSVAVPVADNIIEAERVLKEFLQDMQRPVQEMLAAQRR